MTSFSASLGLPSKSKPPPASTSRSGGGAAAFVTDGAASVAEKAATASRRLQKFASEGDFGERFGFELRAPHRIAVAKPSTKTQRWAHWLLEYQYMDVVVLIVAALQYAIVLS